MKELYKEQNIRILDFEKAFDSLNWNFHYDSLEYLNLGNTFIGYIKTMYQDIESTIVNNGTSGKFFKFPRGVRQGFPLSAYVFITALETLTNKIRNDKNIKGIKINKREIKICLLADDIILIHFDLDSVKNTINLPKCFSLCAGLKININSKIYRNSFF